MNLSNLPNEILTLIAVNLKGKDILAFEEVSKRFRSICLQPSLWRNKIYNEFDIIVDQPSKRDYLETYFYVYFSIVCITTNFNINNLHEIGKNVHGNRYNNNFSIFCVDLSNNRDNVYANLRKRLIPTEGEVLVLDNSLNSGICGLNSSNINKLFQNKSTCFCGENKCNAIWENELTLNKQCGLPCSYTINGKRIKRRSPFVYVFVVILSHCEQFLDVYNHSPWWSHLRYINFFNTKEEIVKWMESGGLGETSSSINNDGTNYKIDYGSYVNSYTYIELTNNIINNSEKEGGYCLTWGNELIFKFEVLEVTNENQCSFHFEKERLF